MRQLNRTESVLYMIGGILLAVGAGFYAFFLYQPVMCWVMLIGACLFVAMQVRQSYDGQNVTIRRLRRIMFFAHACFVIAGLFMVEDSYHFVLPFFAKTLDGYTTYVNVFRHNWVVALLIGAALEMYTTHRISYELKKEAQNTEKTLK